MCLARTRTLRLRRNRITRVFGVCYPGTYNDVTNGSAPSELLILPRFQTSRSATRAQIHDPPVTQTRPAGLRECCRSPCLLLTDRICSCAYEDSVMPFKYSKRAPLVGETTSGSFSLTRHVDYENGMILNIAAVHHIFPDGSQFEGVGITPDVAVDMTPEDFHADRDPVLQKAIELAQQH